MPNQFSYIVLLLWPFISMLLFKKLNALQAVFWTIVGGFLILPVRAAIDFPLLPPLDKNSIPALSALAGCILTQKINITLIPKKGIERLLVISYLLCTLFTVITNQDSVFNGMVWIAGMNFHDVLSEFIRRYIYLIPFILSVQLVKSYNDQMLLFKYLVIAVLFYSIPILFEIRMSPQLHVWIYGFFPSSFGQQMRYGGFRSVVFLGHGLTIAMLVSVSLGGVVLLWKNKIKIIDVSNYILVMYILFLLILSKSLGPFIEGLIFVVAIIYLANSTIKRFAKFLLFFVMFYPLLMFFDLIPHQEIVEIISNYYPERAQSIEFRYMNEISLFEHAKEKLLFGWGGWGRNQHYDSVTDGGWIIAIGLGGIFGYLIIYGLPALSILRGIKSSEFLINSFEQKALSIHILIIAISMFDTLLNGGFATYMWLFVGALLGRANYLIANKQYISKRLLA